MSLADELLADLEEIAEEGEDEELNDDHKDGDGIEDIDDMAMDVDNKGESVKNIAKLRHSKEVSIMDFNNSVIPLVSTGAKRWLFVITHASFCLIWKSLNKM